MPGHSHGVLLDVTNTSAIAPLITRIKREIGPIEVLVNNAGYGHEGVFDETAEADMRLQFDVNLFGPAALMRAVLPHMRGRSGDFLWDRAAAMPTRRRPLNLGRMSMAA